MRMKCNQGNGANNWALQRFPVPFATLILYCFFTLPPLSARACGWWGDGEMSTHSGSQLTDPDGKPIPETLNLQTARLPGREGYGIAVLDAGQAVPYLQATHGRPLNRIGELRAFGFKAVIDIGTAVKTARLHRSESKAVGMRYFNIPTKNDTPSPQQVRLFTRLVMEASDGPLLVYAPTAPLLGFMWANHRFNIGSPLEFALTQGKALGMTPAQEDVLRKRAETN